MALGGWPRVELRSRSSARRCPQTARLNRCGRLGAKSALTASKPCLLGRPCRHDCGMDLTGDGHVHTEWSYGFALAVEIGDWHRFTSATIGAFVGLVPTESSSGQSRSQGSITKTGNTHARRLL